VRLKGTGGELCADKIEIDGVKNSVDRRAIPLQIHQILVSNCRIALDIDCHECKTPICRRFLTIGFKVCELLLESFGHIYQFGSECVQKLC
jgi:hypothetical protein